MKEKIKQLQSFFLVLLLSIMSTVTAWADTQLTISPCAKSDKDTYASAYWFQKDGTVITNIVGAGAYASSTGYNNGTPKISINGKNNPNATITFTIASGVTITSFKVTGSMAQETECDLDGTSVTFGTALTSLNKTSSMVFRLHCKDAESSSTARNTTISSFVLTYTTSGGEVTYTATSAVSPAGTGMVTMKNTNSSGSTISSGSSVASGTTIWMQAYPETGYNFSAWSNGTTGSSNPTTATLDGNKTFQANFTAKTYAITLDKGTDGTANGSATATYNSSTLTSKTDATKTGYTLTGYYTAASSGTKVINADGSLVANVSGYTGAGGIWTKDDDATLYAQWEAASGYTITYDVNTKADGSTLMADAIDASAGQTTLPNPLPTPSNVKTGYTFLGWCTDAALTTAATAGASIEAATTLYANYKINATTISPASGNIKGGQTLTITAPTGVTLTKAYYKWSGSKTFGKDDMVDSDGNAINSAGTTTTGSFTGTTTTGDTRKVSWVITDGKWYSVAQNTTYDVHSYTVTYNGNGNTGGTDPTDASSPYAKSSTPTVLGAGTLVKSGYTFDGWNTVADGSGTAYAASSTLAAMTANVTLYAQWVAAVTEYTITLNGNGGTGGSASVTATLNETLPSFTAPIRSGYVLKGYYTETSGGTKVIDADGTLVASTSYANSSSQWTSTANLTVYAQWDPIYTVTFDATTNSGTCATASLTQASYGASIILPAATKEGYTFDGWFEASSGGEPVGVAGASYIPSTSKTLYAQFSAAVATTKFHFLSKTASSGNIQTASELQITESNYADDVTDGDVYYFNNNSSRDYKYGMKLGGNAEYLRIVLDTPLAIGDVITFVEGNGSSNQISFTTTATRSTTPATSENTYTVTSTDGLAGENTIYVWRASGSTTYVKEITITTSGEAATYAVSFEMGGIADDIEQLTEQTTLPDPLPTPTGVADGYTFEGWYTNSTFTTAATAGAALGANATLYANYIIDTPTITPNGGEIYAGTAMTLTADVPFTQVYAQWTGADAAFSKATAVDNPGGYRAYNSTAVDTYNFTCADGAHGTRYFAYMISDGTFYSVPAITSAFAVSHLITISEQPTSATYIKDAEASAITVSAEVTGSGTDAGTLSYQWKQCATEDGDYVNVSAGSGGTTDSYTPVTSSTGTTYFKCVISSNNGAASVETNVVYVTVNTAAAFTVSFDKGIGSNTEVESITEASSGAGITLPTVTVSSADRYQFDGWYLEGEKVGAAYESYSPSGNVTLTAKYKCKVTLTKGLGEGNQPTAVIKSTGATINSGDYVLEGTTITLTASPAANFTGWETGTSGTTNPKDFVLNDYKEFVANYVVPEYKTLFHTTFPSTETGWSSVSGVSGGGTASGVGDDTYAPHDVTLKGGTSDSYTWTSGKLTVPQNYGSNNYIAIPVKGVNGELTITVANGSSKTQFNYNVVLGAATNSPGSGTSTTKAAPSTVNVTGLTASNYVVYIGRTSKSYKDFTEITITTPNTSLTSDSAQVRVMGTEVVVPVNITTSYEGGTISIKTAPTGSIATASYNSGTGVLTITSKGAGTTSVVMQLKNGEETLRELTIPITVQVPTITIKTQPENVVCYQHDATEKTMSVVATVNTGNELTYQWYSNTAASTSSPTPTLIPGATSATYTLNTADKATVGTKYYFCKVTSATDDIYVYTDVKSVTVSALTAGTYSANLFVGTKGNELTYSGLGESTTISSGAGSASDPYTASISSGTLTITSNKVGTGTITLSNSVIINVTVKKHTISLIWSADSKSYNVEEKGWSTGDAMTIDDGSHPENLPYLIRLYEDGTEYTGQITYYIDDTSIAYFGDTPGTSSYTKASGPSAKPTIRYGGTQGGCKFYAYIASGDDAEDVKTSYDLRLERGYSNVLPSGRKVEVQQQYTMYIPDTDTKLITVTYGGYKYNDHTWNNKADSWGSAAAISGLTNIDGYKYAVRNKDRDAADEYMHAVHQEDDNFGSAWYDNTYTRIKPFRLPCRASYLTFYAHQSGTLTAYVYQNGIVGRGGSANQLASGPRLGYWFDQDGYVQHPIGTVVTKQTIANSNARDKRPFGGYDDMDGQLDTWTNEDDALVVKRLRSKYSKHSTPTDNTELTDYEEDKVVHDGITYPYENPYYWGKSTDVTANNDAIMPTPERPIPHQNGYMIVNEGYVKYTINVVAGKTYYFFGKMTKVGYAGMNFIPADETSGAYTTEGFTDYSHETTRLDLAADDNWTTLFGASGTALKNTESTLYDQVTVPSNYRIGKWNTICLPFAVNENQVEQVFGKDTELAIFNGLRHDTENHVYYIKYLRHVDQNILPGQPYLIYPTGRAVTERSNQENGGMAETGEDIATVGSTDKIIGSTSTGGSGTRIVFSNVLIEKGVTAQSYGSNTDVGGGTSYVFTGTDQKKAIAKYDLYITPKSGELKRYMPTDPSTTMNLNTYHAFVKAESAEIKQDAITFAFTEDDVIKSWEAALIDNVDPDDPETTGVEVVEDDSVSVKNAKAYNGKTYNVMGQEVDSRSAKGLVIVNGKKYIK